MKYLKQIKIKNKIMLFPIYFPDATRGVVRSLDAHDLKKAGVEGLVVNTYHLMSQPGISVLEVFSGIKSYMGWQGWVVSDSGGWQLLSMIYKNPLLGKVFENGVVFYQGSSGEKKKYLFTPEKSIQVQFDIGTDILVCLDDCPGIQASQEETKKSCQRTIEWAKRSKEEYLKQLEKRKISANNKPFLLAVVQGGDDKKLREKCAQELIKIGFDGFGFGGWPLDHHRNLNKEILEFTANLLPENLPKFALGIGDPQAIVECFQMGYNMFDCVLPTRDARHQRLYLFSKEPENINILNEKETFDHFYILRAKYAKDKNPLSQFCDCFTCKNYSRAYLYHLFKIKDSLAWRLGTIHNLRTYTKLIENLRRTLRLPRFR